MAENQNAKFYTVKEAAEVFRVSERTLWRWIKSGRLTATKFGKIYRITPEEIRRVLAAMPGEEQEEREIDLMISDEEGDRGISQESERDLP